MLCRCLPPTATPSSNTPSSDTPSPQDSAATSSQGTEDRAVLPSYPETEEAGRELTDFLRKNNISTDLVSSDITESCTSVTVSGADLAQGDIDVYLGLPGGDCGGDAAGTLYKIRGHKVVNSVAGCWECEDDQSAQATSTYKRMLDPYGERIPASFQGSAAGVLVPNKGEW